MKDVFALAVSKYIFSTHRRKYLYANQNNSFYKANTWYINHSALLLNSSAITPQSLLKTS